MSKHRKKPSRIFTTHWKRKWKETALQQAQFEENLASLEVETAKEAQEGG